MPLKEWIQDHGKYLQKPNCILEWGALVTLWILTAKKMTAWPFLDGQIHGNPIPLGKTCWTCELKDIYTGELCVGLSAIKLWQHLKLLPMLLKLHLTKHNNRWDTRYLVLLAWLEGRVCTWPTLHQQKKTQVMNQMLVTQGKRGYPNSFWWCEQQQYQWSESNQGPGCVKGADNEGYSARV